MSWTHEGRRLPRWARKRPPMAGRALAGGFGPPAGTNGEVIAWQGHLPLPSRTGFGHHPSAFTPRVSPSRVSGNILSSNISRIMPTDLVCGQ